jgi:hypothetical protein
MELGSSRDDHTPVRLSARIGLKKKLLAAQAAQQTENGGSAPAGGPTSLHAIFAKTSARKKKLLAPDGSLSLRRRAASSPKHDGRSGGGSSAGSLGYTGTDRSGDRGGEASVVGSPGSVPAPTARERAFMATGPPDSVRLDAGGDADGTSIGAGEDEARRQAPWYLLEGPRGQPPPSSSQRRTVRMPSSSARDVPIVPPALSNVMRQVGPTDAPPVGGSGCPARVAPPATIGGDGALSAFADQITARLQLAFDASGSELRAALAETNARTGRLESALMGNPELLDRPLVGGSQCGEPYVSSLLPRDNDKDRLGGDRGAIFNAIAAKAARANGSAPAGLGFDADFDGGGGGARGFGGNGGSCAQATGIQLAALVLKGETWEGNGVAFIGTPDLSSLKLRRDPLSQLLLAKDSYASRFLASAHAVLVAVATELRKGAEGAPVYDEDVSVWYSVISSLSNYVENHLVSELGADGPLGSTGQAAAQQRIDVLDEEASFRSRPSVFAGGVGTNSGLAALNNALVDAATLQRVNDLITGKAVVVKPTHPDGYFTPPGSGSGGAGSGGPVKREEHAKVVAQLATATADLQKRKQQLQEVGATLHEKGLPVPSYCKQPPPRVDGRPGAPGRAGRGGGGNGGFNDAPPRAAGGGGS